MKKASTLLKKDGYLVYSTCTIEEEENFGVVSEFLKENINFKLENAKDIFDENLLDANGCVQTFPNIHKIDGVFAAKIKRIE